MKKLICFLITFLFLSTSATALLLQAAPEEARSFVEAEEKDEALENGEPASMDYGVGTDVNASSEKYQGVFIDYAYVYYNIARSNTVKVTYASTTLPLTLTFSYRTTADGEWQEAGSGELDPFSVAWWDFIEQEITLSNEIPDGAQVKVDTDADNETKGANLDCFTFSYVDSTAVTEAPPTATATWEPTPSPTATKKTTAAPTATAAAATENPASGKVLIWVISGSLGVVIVTAMVVILVVKKKKKG